MTTAADEYPDTVTNKFVTELIRDTIGDLRMIGGHVEQAVLDLAVEGSDPQQHKRLDALTKWMDSSIVLLNHLATNSSDDDGTDFRRLTQM